MNRPRPVLVLGLVLVALTAVTTFADVQNIIPNVVLTWTRLATAVLGAVGTFWVQNRVTPLSSPQTRDGRPMVPSPPAEVSPFLRPADRDATAD